MFLLCCTYVIGASMIISAKHASLILGKQIEHRGYGLCVNVDSAVPMGHGCDDAIERCVGLKYSNIIIKSSGRHSQETSKMWCHMMIF